MSEFGTLGEIQYNRVLGFDAGQAFIKQHGLQEASDEARRISDNQTPTPAEYGFIDGFLNAVVEKTMNWFNHS